MKISFDLSLEMADRRSLLSSNVCFCSLDEDNGHMRSDVKTRGRCASGSATLGSRRTLYGQVRYTSCERDHIIMLTYQCSQRLLQRCYQDPAGEQQCSKLYSMVVRCIRACKVLFTLKRHPGANEANRCSKRNVASFLVPREEQGR